MGYLLKEALKTLCGVDQWSYAVFWKIGCQNPKLLIWEECYHGPITFSCLPHTETVSPGIAFDNWEACWASTESRSFPPTVVAGDRVQQLVSKMMMDNQVSIVGEGLVGRAAFTGNYQWILSQNYSRESHPPEVLNELNQQFAAGMQTVAVIPVLPNGVFQFGSSKDIIENTGFVNDVRTLILQLACVAGALFSESYATPETVPKEGASFRHLQSTSVDSCGKSKCSNLSRLSSNFYDNYHQDYSQVSGVVGQTSNLVFKKFEDSLQPSRTTFQNSRNSEKLCAHGQDEVIGIVNSKFDSWSQQNGVAGSERISPNLEGQQDLKVSLHTPGFKMNQERYMGTVATHSGSSPIGLWDLQMLADDAAGNNVNNKLNESNTLSSQIGSTGALSYEPDKTYHGLVAPVSTSLLMDKKYIQLCLDEGNEKVENDMGNAINIPCCSSDENNCLSGKTRGYEDDRNKHDSAYCSAGLNNSLFESGYMQPHSGDDLFDMLGLNFANELYDESFLINGPGTKSENPDKNNYVSNKLQSGCPELRVDNKGNSESGIFSAAGTDHLLDAVVSKVQSATNQSSEDNESCRTTLTKFSSSSTATASFSNGRAKASNHVHNELFGISKSLKKAEPLSFCSFKSASEDVEKLSQTNSFNRSRISTHIGQDCEMKITTSSSTAYSKRADENSKRKRLKPGENPRPRPKDRQMIQDRVKELREIVPNGAKCSIDALLERTIKHMIFLQNVTKQGDKLKHIGESKIVSDENGLMIKDNFKVGATWAYEVGSQSMVCPIIVEDLSPPRQMFVEMLCEKRGLFLEIADIVRGLGLTILKGVMEARNDKIWARFTVEANRDVTRMEIFVSLVRLMEQTVNSTSLPVNCIVNDNMMSHQPVKGSVAIPVIGMPHCTR